MRIFQLLLLLLCTANLSFSEEPLGSIDNPIRCDMPSGEHWYLSRLRKEKGKDLSWKRAGSFGGKNGELLDGYVGEGGAMIYFDMYHPRYVEIVPPPGYRLLWEWSDSYEYIKGLICDIKTRKPFTGKIDIKVDDVRIVCEINEGLIKGKFSRFHANQQLMCVSSYKENKLTGKEEWYREDGRLLAVCNYKEGLLDGVLQLYDEDGKLEVEKNYKEGVVIKDKNIEQDDEVE